jgi:hypothetical protein
LAEDLAKYIPTDSGFTLVVREKDERYALCEYIFMTSANAVLVINEWTPFHTLKIKNTETMEEYLKRIRGHPSYDWKDGAILMLILLLYCAVLCR